MEAASWLAGEPWTDHPRSVHPVIAGVARAADDSVSDAERTGLWPPPLRCERVRELERHLRS